MSSTPRYVLTLSCQDVKGIVAAVTGFLTEQDGFIIESGQFGDPSTSQFFMRTEFSAGPKTPELSALCNVFHEKVAQRFGMQWQIDDIRRKARLLLMVSKARHCLNDLLHRYHTGWLPVEIPAVVSNHNDLKDLCDFYRIPFHHMPVTAENKAEQEQAVLTLAENLKIDLVVLARYMQVLSPDMVARLQGKAINIHHSFLPSFKGARPYHQAYDRGVKLIGATAHYVSDALDEGPIIEQEIMRVNHSMSADDLAAIGGDVESLVLARAVKYHIEHRVLPNGTKTVVFA